MRKLLSLIVAFCIGFALTALLFNILWALHDHLGLNYRDIDQVCLVWLCFVSMVSYYICHNTIFKNIKTFKEYASNVISSSKNTINSYHEAKEEDLKYYGMAEEEINLGTIKKDIWALALVKAKGDETVRKAEYIKLRVNQLKKEN